MTTRARPLGRVRSAGLLILAAATLAIGAGATSARAAQATTTTTLTSSLNPSTFLQAVTLTVTVGNGGPTAPTGSVSFVANGATLGTRTLVGGTASLTTVSLAGAQDPIRASYLGDAANASSFSNEVLQTVNPVGTVLSVGASQNPSGAGQQVSFTANARPASSDMVFSYTSDAGDVAGGGGGRTITFPDASEIAAGGGSGDVLSALVDGGGEEWHLSFTPPAGQQWHAGVYGGAGPIPQPGRAGAQPGISVWRQGSYACAASSGSFTISDIEVSPGGSVTWVVLDFEQHCGGAAAALRGHLAAAATTEWYGANGSPTFTDAATGASAQPAGSGSAPWSAALSLGAGDHTITAAFPGDGRFAPATAQIVQHVLAVPTLGVSMSPQPAPYGQPLTVTATAATSAGLPTPTGAVTVAVDGGPGQAAALDGKGVATLSISPGQVGSHTLTIGYGGDAVHASTSTTAAVTVVQSAASVTLSASPNPAAYGAPVTLTASVPGSTGGLLTVTDGGATLGGIGVQQGSAVITVSTLAIGKHVLRAVYNGDANLTSGSSPSVTVTVGRAATVLDLTPSSNPSVPGQRVTLSAAALTPLGVPHATGTVTFTDAGATLGSGPLDASGVAVLSVVLPAGTHTLGASYGGDADDQPGTAAPVTQTVVAAGPSLRYVDQLYNDILGRPADGGAASWATSLDQHRIDRTGVALALTGSTEYLTDQIQAMYRAHLGRDADAGGLLYWLGYIRGGGTFEQLEVSFIGAPEYYTDAGGTPDGFLDAVYRDVFGRSPDDGGRAYWDARLTHGTPQWQVAMALVTSLEAMGNRVDGDYLLLLGRHAETQGRDSWVQRLLGGTRDETLVGYLAGSDECWNRTQAM